MLSINFLLQIMVLILGVNLETGAPYLCFKAGCLEYWKDLLSEELSSSSTLLFRNLMKKNEGARG